MRHFLSPSPIAPGARGMIAPTARGRLVTLPGCALFAAPVRLGAASLTVDVAAIAARADQHLDAAARTKIQTRGCICLFAFVTQTWTKAPTDAILPRHACLGTVWGMAPIQTCRGWDRRRACLQRRQPFNSSSSAASPSELGLLGAFRSRTTACLACSRQRRWLLVTRADCTRSA